MIKFVAGLILGVSISAALAQGSVDDIMREIARTVRTPLPTMDNPIHEAYPTTVTAIAIVGGLTRDGVGHTLLVDDYGRAICAPEGAR
jgi:hypothetical protein